MLRSIATAFVAGWLLWFWLDKAGPGYQFALGQSGGTDLVRDFQLGVDLLKHGAVGPAFAFLWRHHFLVLSVALGVAGLFLLRGLARGARQALGRVGSGRSRSPRVPSPPVPRVRPADHDEGH
jgi:hypothetical protein